MHSHGNVANHSQAGYHNNRGYNSSYGFSQQPQQAYGSYSANSIPVKGGYGYENEFNTQNYSIQSQKNNIAASHYGGNESNHANYGNFAPSQAQSHYGLQQNYGASAASFGNALERQTQSMHHANTTSIRGSGADTLGSMMYRHGTPDPETHRHNFQAAMDTKPSNNVAHLESRILELETALSKANKSVSEMATNSVKLKQVRPLLSEF